MEQTQVPRTAEDWMRAGKSPASANLRAQLDYMCRINVLLSGEPKPHAEMGSLSKAEMAGMEQAFAAGTSPEMFVAFVKSCRKTITVRCAGKVHDRQWNMEIGCGETATVTRAGVSYCGDHDPEGERMKNRADWVRRTANAADKHRADAAERLADAELAAVKLLEGRTDFRYRDEMFAFLCEARKAELGGTLPQSQYGLLRAAVIPLWGKYARLNGLDVRMVFATQYEQVERAKALKAKQAAQ